MLTAWFPAGALLEQRSALSKTESNLSHLRQQDRQLEQEKALLSRPNEVSRIARQDYGLVGPGQRSFEVLPPSASGSANPYAGDPGLQPLAAPNSGAVPGGTGGTGSGASHTASQQSHPGTGRSSNTSAKSHPAPSGLWGRITNTLEFWR